MTQLDIVVDVSRVHNADILLDLASCMFSLFMSQEPLNPPPRLHPRTLPLPAMSASYSPDYKSY